MSAKRLETLYTIYNTDNLHNPPPKRNNGTKIGGAKLFSSWTSHLPQSMLLHNQERTLLITHQ